MNMEKSGVAACKRGEENELLQDARAERQRRPTPECVRMRWHAAARGT